MMKSSAMLIAAILLTGCDTGHGVRRVTSFPGTVVPDQVISAVKLVPEITSVKHTTLSGSEVYTLYGNRQEPPCEQYQYNSSKSLGGVIEFRPADYEQTEIKLYCISFTQMSDQMISRVRQTMDQVYKSLGTAITNLPPLESVQETIMK